MGIRLLFFVFVALILWGVIYFQPPIWVFPTVFVVIFLFYSNTLRERVPLFLSNRTTWAALAQLMNNEPKSDNKTRRFVDLGCGLGGTVAFLARHHPHWHVVGVETAPGPYLISKLRVAFIANAEVRFQSLWSVQLGDYDMAYAFLSPAPMKRLCTKVQDQMPAGSLFVSNSFWPDDEPYDQDVLVNDSRESHLICKRV